ncbi:MAG: TonB-dependent receptor [Flavobacteriaceae bacterium]|nr:TonB-dependent receptor [Flavobacteriaceae bacterium]
MKKNFFLFAALFTASITVAQEQPKTEQLDSVVIDTKLAKARKNSGKIVSTITAEMLERSAGKSVATLLNEVAGIEINGSRSNDGQNLGYFIRGGRNRQVLIVLDGVALNDPSQISNDYDLRLVSASQIERIEILKGASSVLYGSGAGTAVISITTKKASGNPVALNLTTSLGSNQSSEEDAYKLGEFLASAQLSGTINKLFYSGSINGRFTDGLSAIAAPEGEALFESDVFNRFNTHFNLGYKISEKIKISRFVASDKFKSDFDDFSYLDAENRTISEQFRTGGNFQWSYGKGKLQINDSHSWIDREIESSFPAMYDSQSSNIDAFANYQLGKNIGVLAGLNLNFSSFNSFTIPFGSDEFNQDVSDEIAKFDIIDPYVSVNYNSDFGLNLNAGARLNNHSNYGTNWVYNVNPSYVFDFGNSDLKVLGSYSTAYITPSLFQLYDPLYGNEELQPEENTTIEGGAEFSVGRKTRISAIYFSRNEQNFVDFVTVDPNLFLFQYQNISEEFDTSGFELELSQKIGEKLDLSTNYTNTQADERFALRIPEHKVNAALNFSPDAKSELGLSIQYVSERDDSFFNSETFESETIVLDSFSLFNFSASRQFTPNVKVFFQLSNILNEEFEELYRFQTRGRNWRLGLTLNI